MSAVTQILLLVSYAVFGTATAVSMSLFGVDTTGAMLAGSIVFIVAWQIQTTFFRGAKDKVDAIDMHRVEEIEKLALKLREDVAELTESLSEQSEKGDEKDKKLVSELKMLQEFLLQVMQKETRGKKAGGSAKKSGTPVDQTADPAPDPDDQMTAEEIEELGLAPEEAALVVIDDGDDEFGDTEPSATKLEDDAETNAEEDVAVNPEEASGSDSAGNSGTGGGKDIADQQTGKILPATSDKATTAIPKTAPKAAKPIGVPKTAKATPAKNAAPAQRRTRTGKPRAPIRLIKREDQLLSVIKSSLSENRVDLYLQPMVALPSRKTAHFECFSRVRDEEGRVVLPRQYMKVAETKGLIGTIDNLLLFRLVQLVRKLGKRRPDVRFFLNMSRYSISDSEFLPQFVDFMISNQEFASRMVFEISQDDYLSLEEETVDKLRVLGKQGFGFSMDLVTDFEQDFAELERNHFRYIKADLADISAANPEPGEIEEQKSYLARRGMQLIASKIETEEMVIETLDNQIELAQGYLFGEPIVADEMDSDL